MATPVLPDLELRARALADGVSFGRHASARVGRGIEFAGHRAYTRGDDARRIDWRAYGRTDRLTIREAEVETDHAFWMVLDTSASMAMPCGADATKFDHAQTMAAALAMIAERQGDRYGVIEWGSSWRIAVDLGRGGRWLQRTIGTIDTLSATARPTHSDWADRRRIALPDYSQAADVFVLTDGYDCDGDIVRGLAHLEQPRRRLTIAALESTLESQPAASGTLRLQDLESGTQITVDEAAFAEARIRRKQYYRDLRRDLANNGVRLLELPLPTSGAPDLRPLLRQDVAL